MKRQLEMEVQPSAVKTVPAANGALNRKYSARLPTQTGGNSCRCRLTGNNPALCLISQRSSADFCCEQNIFPKNRATGVKLYGKQAILPD